MCSYLTGVNNEPNMRKVVEGAEDRESKPIQSPTQTDSERDHSTSGQQQNRREYFSETNANI